MSSGNDPNTCCYTRPEVVGGYGISYGSSSGPGYADPMDLLARLEQDSSFLMNNGQMLNSAVVKLEEDLAGFKDEVKEKFVEYLLPLVDENVELRALVAELEASVHSLMEQVNDLDG